jgi:hypothetical protein
MTQSARNNAHQATDEAVRASSLAADAATHAREAIADVAHTADETLGDLATRVKDRIHDLPGPHDLKAAVEERARVANVRVPEKAGIRSRLTSKPVLLIAIAAVAFVVMRMLRGD